MRATNGLGPEYQHWPIHLTIDMGIRMLPWALSQAGLDLTGYSIQVDVEGAGGGTWHWGLGAGEAPPTEKKPDTTIVGRGRTWRSWRPGGSPPMRSSLRGTSSPGSTRSSAPRSCATSGPTSEGTARPLRSYPFSERNPCTFFGERCPRATSTPTSD